MGYHHLGPQLAIGLLPPNQSTHHAAEHDENIETDARIIKWFRVEIKRRHCEMSKRIAHRAMNDSRVSPTMQFLRWKETTI